MSNWSASVMLKRHSVGWCVVVRGAFVVIFAAVAESSAIATSTSAATNDFIVVSALCQCKCLYFSVVCIYLPGVAAAFAKRLR